MYLLTAASNNLDHTNIQDTPDALVIPGQGEPVLAAEDRPPVVGHIEGAPRGRRKLQALGAAFEGLELKGNRGTFQRK